MLERVRDAGGEFLELQPYVDDFRQHLRRHIGRFDKLERLQHFREPGDPSWEAFAAGRWEEALELKQRNRPNVVAEFADDAVAGLVSYRVRVVQFPVAPYLHWELYALKIRVECGENIRVVGPEAVARYEQHGVVPELIFMADRVMYEICYDETGTRYGGRKFTDPELIKGCLADVQALYAEGEDFLPFFDREIAPLPPPVIEPEITASADS